LVFMRNRSSLPPDLDSRENDLDQESQDRNNWSAHGSATGEALSAKGGASDGDEFGGSDFFDARDPRHLHVFRQPNFPSSDEYGHTTSNEDVPASDSILSRFAALASNNYLAVALSQASKSVLGSRERQRSVGHTNKQVGSHPSELEEDHVFIRVDKFISNSVLVDVAFKPQATPLEVRAPGKIKIHHDDVVESKSAALQAIAADDELLQTTKELMENVLLDEEPARIIKSALKNNEDFMEDSQSPMDDLSQLFDTVTEEINDNSYRSAGRVGRRNVRIVRSEKIDSDDQGLRQKSIAKEDSPDQPASGTAAGTPVGRAGAASQAGRLRARGQHAAGQRGRK